MRLWHKDLLPFLPRQQLLSQWRECCSIVKNIAEKGSPNHILVNRIMDYPEFYFQYYVQKLHRVMQKRGYKISEAARRRYANNLEKAKPKFTQVQTEYDDFELFAGWHDDRYLRQCLYNLEEKFICGGISAAEWKIICENFSNYDLYM